MNYLTGAPPQINYLVGSALTPGIHPLLGTRFFLGDRGSPNYLTEAVSLGVNRKEQRNVCTMTRSYVEESTPFIQTLVENLLTSCSSIEEIAENLLQAECKLNDIICLQNAELTKAFLKTKDKTSYRKFSVQELALKDPYIVIDNDTRESVDHVMNKLDLENAEVILRYGQDKDLRIRHYIHNLITMTTEHENLKTLKVFLDKIIEWNILDQEGSRLIEQKVFNEANKDILQIFLQFQTDTRIKKLFEDNVLAAMFGNPNVKINSLKNKRLFNVNVAGFKNFTALHYAVKNKLFKKVKFLLHRGAEPNSKTRSSVTPFTLTMWEPQVDQINNAKCAEILLQHGADLFIESLDMVAFVYCVLAKRALSGEAPFLYQSVGYLTELAVAYMCIHEAASLGNDYLTIIENIRVVLEENQSLFSFYNKCQRELQMLKEHEIRKNLTMFTIVSKIGKDLFELVNVEDQKIINTFIDKYNKEMTVIPYYLNAIREHMRQFRKLAAHKNRAMRLISINAKTLAPYALVLEKIVSYLTYKDKCDINVRYSLK